MVSQRGLDVLRAVVHDYVSSREPVGSKSIVDRYSFGVSAATIRNDMALLEDEGLIAAPHTSSGRVPTDKGYRLFVDHLAELRQLTPAQKHAIESVLDESADFDELLARTVRLLAQLTNQVALVQYPSLGVTRVRHVELVNVGNDRLLSVLITDNGRVEQRLIEHTSELSEADITELKRRINETVAGRALTELSANLSRTTPSRADHLASAEKAILNALASQILASREHKLVMAGTANLAKKEEDFGGTIYPVLDAIEEQVTVLKLLAEMAQDQPDVTVRIGHEHDEVRLGQTSVLATNYAAAGEMSSIGLIGPTRMDYSSNMAAVRAVARYLSRLLDSAS